MFDLTQYRPNPHRLKDFFRQNKVPQHIIAHILGHSQSMVNCWLAGYLKMPEQVEMKLQEFADTLRAKNTFQQQ